MKGNTAISNSQRAGPWRILVVTESLVDQKLLTALLAKHQHRVFLAADVHEALSECSRNDFDVVLLDSILSEMDGAELARVIRSREKPDCRVPIMVLSDGEVDGGRCLEAGVDGCLSRPFQVDELQAQVFAVRQRPATTTAIEPVNKEDLVDWQVAMDAVGGRRELLTELVEVFFTEYPTTLTAIQQAIDNHDAKALQLSAHQLKGCLRYFGATTACDLARNLEDMGRAGELKEAGSKIEPLSGAIERLLPQLRQGPS